jgi:Lrp/AsnC family leucine-responsive transcriptional regulator
MDAIDRHIVRELSTDARMSATELAGRVGLSVSSTAERLRRLLTDGTIDGFDVRLNPALTGRSLNAYLSIYLHPTADIEAVDRALRNAACVVDAKSVTGDASYLIQIAATDTGELDRLINHLRYDLGVSNTTTTIVLSTLDGFPRLPDLE